MEKHYLNITNAAKRMCVVVSLFLVAAVSPFYAQHQHGNMGGNQQMQMQHNMNTMMENMQTMMNQISRLADRSGKMLLVMKTSDNQTQHDMNPLNVHAKSMTALMQDMNDMSGNMKNIIAGMNKIMNDPELMKNDEMHTHVESMMKNMKNIMKEYESMLNGMEKVQLKEQTK